MLDIITGLIGSLLYPLFSILFLMLDLLQGVFRGFAGVGDIYYGSQKITGGNTLDNISNTDGFLGDETHTGLIYYLLTTDLIKNLLISIAILALFLLIIFTVLAFIRNAYSAKPKSWQEIVGNAFKGLANFVFIPVMCLLGVWLGNVLLNAIDGATSTGGSTQMSRKVFIACAYHANWYRVSQSTDPGRAETVVGWAGLDINVEEGQDYEYYAEIVDRCYASGNIKIHDADPLWRVVTGPGNSIATYVMVGEGYSLFRINYLFLAIAGGFMCYVLINIAYGMIKRMFMLVILFVISPALCAMYPLDEGKAVGSWKGDFIKQTVSAYGAVAAMNLFMSIMPLIERISFAGQGGSGFAVGSITDYIIQLLILISGLFVVKDLIGTLSGYVGGDNAFSAGQSLRSSTKGAIKKAGGKVTSVASAFNKARGAREAGGSFFGSLAKQARDTGFKEVLGLDTKKIKDAKDEGIKDFEEKGVKDRKKGENKNKIQTALNGDEKTASKFSESDFKEGVDLGGKLDVSDLKVTSKDDAIELARKSGLAGGALDKFVEELVKNLNRYTRDNVDRKDRVVYGTDDIKNSLSNKLGKESAAEQVLSAGDAVGKADKNYTTAKTNLNDATLSDYERNTLDSLRNKRAQLEQQSRETMTTSKGRTVATADAKDAAAKLDTLNQLEIKQAKFEKAQLEFKEAERAMKDAAEAFSDTILRNAESVGEAQKAQAIDVANTLKANLDVDPSKLTKNISDAVTKGLAGGKTDKSFEEMLKELKKLLGDKDGSSSGSM